MGHGRLAAYGGEAGRRCSGSAPDDVCYSVMPLFHSNAAVAGFANVRRVAARPAVLRRRFSASGLPARRPPLRRHVLQLRRQAAHATSSRRPKQPDDADNSLRIAFGNEAAPLDIDRFAQRFGCVVADGYGSTEGGMNMGRTPETPPGSLGMPVAAVRAVDLRSRDRRGVPAARSSTPTAGSLNAEEAIGEIVNPDGGGGFEGYYNNPEANAERMRDGVYWTGDLGYRDEHGFFYFAGRNSDWLRVDGENFAADAGGARARPAPGRRARRGLRGAVRRRRRRGDGRAPSARRARLRPRRVRRVPRRAVRPLTQVGAALRAGRRAACRRPRRRRC